MGTRGNYLPDGHERMAACNGFYVDNEAIYVSKDIEADWNRLTGQICEKMMVDCPDLEKFNAWRPCEMGQSRYALLSNRFVDLIVETEDGYSAFYLIIPENCEQTAAAKRKFPRYLVVLRQVLTALYPGHVRKRKNAWESLFVG